MFGLNGQLGVGWVSRGCQWAKGILRQIMVTFKRMPGKGEFGDRDFTTGRRGKWEGGFRREFTGK